MRRFLLATAFSVVATASLTVLACGGDSAAPASPTPAPASPTASPTPDPNKQPTPQEVVMPTPTKLPDDGISFQVVSGKNSYNPKPAEARALPTSSITIDGKSYTGITLATLAQKVSAKPDALATIEGIRGDGLRLGFLRGRLSEIGATTLVVPAADGHYNVVSQAFPADQWVNFTTSIAFQ